MFQGETRIVQLKREHPNWGAPKIREKVCRLELGIYAPTISTLHTALDRLDPIKRRRYLPKRER